MDALFKAWEVIVHKAQKDRPFIKDGIIDPVSFAKQKVRVLFISNESNVDGCFDPNVSYDLRTDFKAYAETGSDDWKGKLRERIASLYQVVTGDYSQSPEAYAKAFAFMNLNKTGGGSRIDNRLLDFCTANAGYIREEIRLIRPDLIVWLGCNTFDNRQIREEVVGIRKAGTGYRFDSIPVIRMCHTSYTRIRGNRLGKFDNAITDRMAYRLREEYQKITLT